MLKKYLIKFIIFYQKYISFYLPVNCKFYPTCSEYFKMAVEKKNILLALFLGIKRILRCNSYSKPGFDYLK